MQLMPKAELMHANYWFLNTVEGHPSDDDVWEECEQALCDYLAKFGDENNWSNMHTVLLPGDKQLARQDGCDSVAYKVVPGLWAKGPIMAMSCVMADVEIHDPFSYDGYGAAVAAATGIQDAVDMLLVWLPEQIRQTISRSSGSRFDNYRIKALARSWYTLRSAAVPPFSRRCLAPYEYRAFDLRTHKAKRIQPDDVLMVVNIHT